MIARRPCTVSALRRAVLAIVQMGIAVCPVASAAFANATYPSQLVRIVVPFSAGGPNDYVARPMAQALSEILGGTFVVENKAGADGIIGATVVARAAPDGHTMLITTGSLATNGILGKNLPYDPVKDFRPVTQIAESYGFTLVSRPGLGANDLDDLIALLRRNPGKTTYATSGVGNASHIAAKLFEMAANVAMIDVPYKSGAAGLNDVMSGAVDLAFISASIAGPLIDSGHLRVYASTGNERIPALPTVPTLKERGFKDVVINSYYGLWLPAGVSDELVAKIHDAAAKAVATPGMQLALKRAGLKPVGSTPAQFSAYIANDLRWHGRMMPLIDLTRR